VLATEYDLLLLDEPFSSLDCYRKQKLCDQLEQRSTGITVLFTHEQAILPKTDRIWEIADGRLTDCGPLPDAFRHWRHAPPHIKKLLAAGAHPANLRPADLLEAACRIHG
jgi:energy-coupling factor transport system ATP-binding protein